MEITVKGIARYVHLVTPSQPKGLPDTPMKYSVQVLVHKSDPQCAEINKSVEQIISSSFPSGKPANFNDSWVDLAVTEPDNEVLKDYMALKTAQKAEISRPPVVDTNYKPVINPQLDSELTGQYIWINGGISAYSKGNNNGINVYLNGVLLLGEKGDIPLDVISTKPSVEDMFSGVVLPSTNSTPIVPPTPPVPPVPSQQSSYQMTKKAAGATRDSFIENGWTDEMLIKEGYMVFPDGVKPSFM